MPVAHVYRLLQDEAEAMSHTVQAGESIDFMGHEVKQQAIKHVDRCSEGKYGERPFLSTSTSLEALRPFGAAIEAAMSEGSDDVEIIRAEYELDSFGHVSQFVQEIQESGGSQGGSITTDEVPDVGSEGL